MRSTPSPHLPTRVRLAVSVIGVGLLFSLAGCMSELSEEERHLEHVRPEHKPENYAAAIAELRSRSQADLEETDSETERQELLDIINWLPELAGNSDLRRTQWEQVQSTARELAAFQARGREGSNTLDQQFWNDRLDELEALVPAAGRPERLFVHTEVHDEHDHTKDHHGLGDTPTPDRPDVSESTSPIPTPAAADEEDSK